MGNKTSVKNMDQFGPGADTIFFGRYMSELKKQRSDSPLLAAVDANDCRRIRQLLKSGHNINKRDCNGLTALHLAALNGSEECLELLIQFKPRLMCCSLRQTPLHFAALNGNTNVINALIDYGTVINAKDSMGSTPLGCAVDVDNWEAVETFLMRGAVLHPQVCVSALQKGLTNTLRVLLNFRPNIIVSVDLTDFCFTRVTIPGLKLLFFAGFPFDQTFVNRLQPLEWSDFCLSGRIRLPPEHYNREKDLEAYKWFTEWLDQRPQPNSLKCLSRIAFRNACNEQNLNNVLRSIELPNPIREYLLLKDIN